MNTKSLLSGLLAFTLFATAPIVTAQPTDGQESSSKVAEKSRRSEMEQSLKKVKSFNGRINKKAKYYIYLQSASWCPPCRAEMPEIAKQYAAMKRHDVEIILCSCDRSTDDAKNFLKINKAKFPAITQENAAKLPGFVRANGIPYAIFVTADGDTITSGHGMIVKDWKSIIEKWEAEHASETGEL